MESGRRHTNRPQLKAALDECRKRRATLLIAKLDRLARNVAFIANLMDSRDVDFIAVDMPEANRLTIHILAAVAEHERELTSKRTKDALAVVKGRGVKLGNPRYRESIERARAARGIEKPAPEVQRLMCSLQAQGKGLREIARELNRLGIRTPRGCSLVCKDGEGADCGSTARASYGLAKACGPTTAQPSHTNSRLLYSGQTGILEDLMNILRPIAEEEYGYTFTFSFAEEARLGYVLAGAICIFDALRQKRFTGYCECFAAEQFFMGRFFCIAVVARQPGQKPTLSYEFWREVQHLVAQCTQRKCTEITLDEQLCELAQKRAIMASLIPCGVAEIDDGEISRVLGSEAEQEDNFFAKYLQGDVNNEVR